MVNDAPSSANVRRNNNHSNNNNNNHNNENRPRRNVQGSANVNRRNNHNSNISNNNNNKYKKNDSREVNMSGYGRMISQIEENFSDIKIVGEYTEECVICCKQADVFGVGNCRHPVCIECTVRIRVISNQNVCPVCRTQLDTCSFMWCTKDFASCNLNTPKLGHKDEDRFQVRFQSRDILDRYTQYLSHTCKKCINDDGSRLSFTKFQALRQHMLTAHQLTYCKLCTDNLSTFSREWKTYSRQELGRHTAEGDGDYTSQTGHPKCLFCVERFFDQEAQYKHLRTAHFYCQICEANPETANNFFKEHPELIRHYEKNHFVCDVPDCKNAGIVFKTKLELSLHASSEHSSKAAFNLFNDRPSDRGRGRGRQVVVAPPPPPPPEPPRRNVEVVVVRSAQSTGTTIVGRNRFGDLRNDFPSLPNQAPVPAHERVVQPNEFPRLARVGRATQQSQAKPKTAQPKSIEEEFPTLGGRPQTRPATSSSNGPSGSTENWRKHTGAFEVIDDDERAGSLSHQPARVVPTPRPATNFAASAPSTSKPVAKKPTPKPPAHSDDFPALPSTSALANNSNWAAKAKKSAITGVKMPNKKNIPVPDIWPERQASTPYEPPPPEEWKEIPITKKLTKKEKREQQKLLEEAALRGAELRAQEELEEKKKREAEAERAGRTEIEHVDVALQTAILRDIQDSAGKKESNQKNKNKKKKKADTDDKPVEKKVADVAEAEPVKEKKKTVTTTNSFLHNAENGCDFKKLKSEASNGKVANDDVKPKEPTNESNPDMVSWLFSSVSQKFSGLSLSNIMGKASTTPLSSLPSTPVEQQMNTSVYMTPPSATYSTPPGLSELPPARSSPIVYTAPPGFETVVPGIVAAGESKQTQMFSMAPFISENDVKKPKSAEPETTKNTDGWLQRKK